MLDATPSWQPSLQGSAPLACPHLPRLAPAPPSCAKALHACACAGAQNQPPELRQAPAACNSGEQGGGTWKALKAAAAVDLNAILDIAAEATATSPRAGLPGGEKPAATAMPVTTVPAMPASTAPAAPARAQAPLPLVESTQPPDMTWYALGQQLLGQEQAQRGDGSLPQASAAAALTSAHKRYAAVNVSYGDDAFESGADSPPPARPRSAAGHAAEMGEDDYPHVRALSARASRESAALFNGEPFPMTAFESVQLGSSFQAEAPQPGCSGGAQQPGHGPLPPASLPRVQDLAAMWAQSNSGQQRPPQPQPQPQQVMLGAGTSRPRGTALPAFSVAGVAQGSEATEAAEDAELAAELAAIDEQVVREQRDRAHTQASASSGAVPKWTGLLDLDLDSARGGDTVTPPAPPAKRRPLSAQPEEVALPLRVPLIIIPTVSARGPVDRAEGSFASSSAVTPAPSRLVFASSFAGADNSAALSCAPVSEDGDQRWQQRWQRGAEQHSEAEAPQQPAKGLFQQSDDAQNQQAAALQQHLTRYAQLAEERIRLPAKAAAARAPAAAKPVEVTAEGPLLKTGSYVRAAEVAAERRRRAEERRAAEAAVEAGRAESAAAAHMRLMAEEAAAEEARLLLEAQQAALVQQKARLAEQQARCAAIAATSRQESLPAAGRVGPVTGSRGTSAPAGRAGSASRLRYAAMPEAAAAHAALVLPPGRPRRLLDADGQPTTVSIEEAKILASLAQLDAPPQRRAAQSPLQLWPPQPQPAARGGLPLRVGAVRADLLARFAEDEASLMNSLDRLDLQLRAVSRGTPAGPGGDAEARDVWGVQHQQMWGPAPGSAPLPSYSHFSPAASPPASAPQSAPRRNALRPSVHGRPHSGGLQQGLGPTTAGLGPMPAAPPALLRHGRDPAQPQPQRRPAGESAGSRRQSIARPPSAPRDPRRPPPPADVPAYAALKSGPGGGEVRVHNPALLAGLLCT